MVFVTGIGLFHFIFSWRTCLIFLSVGEYREYLSLKQALLDAMLSLKIPPHVVVVMKYARFVMKARSVHKLLARKLVRHSSDLSGLVCLLLLLILRNASLYCCTD